MAHQEAPMHLVVKIQGGLIDDEMRLGAAVSVEVAPHRRDHRGWPELMVGALVLAPDMPGGVPAVWAASKSGDPIVAVDGAAREYSVWEKDMGPGYPEAEEARRCLPEGD